MVQKYVTKIAQVPQLAQQRPELEEVSKRFAFRANEYYLNLIDWDDPNDPIRRLIIPDTDELNEWGDLDASNEAHYTVAPGLEHKYGPTALLLASKVCAAYCRYCFRKRIFLNENAEVPQQLGDAFEYIRQHKEITNVLLTGGDPLLLATIRLEEVIAPLREIDHVQIIRIGTKTPAFNPFRIIEDETLPQMLSKYSTTEKRIYIIAHFDHARELTDEAVKAMHIMMQAGARAVNQTPIIRGVNDNPQALAELFKKLSFIGIPPYYCFQCRPTKGNLTYSVPIEAAFHIFEQARTLCSGLAKRARFVMSHASGKIEVVGMTEKFIYMKYHSAARVEDKGRFMVFKRHPEANWLEDYGEPVDQLYLERPDVSLPVGAFAGPEWETAE